MELLADDLAGNARAIDATNYANTGVEFFGMIDIGALEAAASTPPPCPCVGNLDETCDTDVFDFAVFAANFGAFVPPFTLGDFDGNGFVNVFDFATFAQDFGCAP